LRVPHSSRPCGGDRAERERAADPGGRFGNRNRDHFAVEVGSPAAFAQKSETVVAVENDLLELERSEPGDVAADVELIGAVAGNRRAAVIINAEGAERVPGLAGAVVKGDDARASGKVDDRTTLQGHGPHAWLIVGRAVFGIAVREQLSGYGSVASKDYVGAVVD